ncbi:MAG: hypothetical protein QOH69_924 [Actinomycetota bacterium]|nr:hypothetical protein [Actinomycetota bacterium]
MTAAAASVRVAGQGNNEEQSRQDHVEREHYSSLGEAAGARGQDERREEQPREDVAGDLRRENGKNQEEVRSLQRHEDSEQASTNRQDRGRPMPRLKVVIFAAPREPRERDTGEQNHLENRETQECETADDRDDLGHPITLVGATRALGATGRPDVRNTGSVSGNENDEALTWAGGRDPSHYETPEAKAPKPPKKVAEAPVEDDDEEEQPPSMSAPVLVSLGILGGIYLLYTVGWFISWQRLLYASNDELELVAFHVQQILAIVAPVLWFVVTLLLTRGRKPVGRLLWLLVGAVVLIPWSFVFGS